jgi:hypothetical protein
MEKLLFLLISLALTGITFSQNVSIGHTAPVASLDIRGVSSSPTIPGLQVLPELA